MVPRVYLYGGATHAAFRRAISASGMSTSMASVVASMVMMSPSCTIAIGPPTCASGATCPTQKPWLPPEKRPSVMSATSWPSPAPMTIEVGESISFMPGPPLGPSYRITMTLPRSDSWSLTTCAIRSSSASKHMAGPWKRVPSLPVILPTAPSGARVPSRMAMCPVALTGLAKVPMTSWPASRPGSSARFSAIVLPVIVMQSPCRWPCSSMYLRTPGVPPTACRSSMTYFPEGLRLAMKGVSAARRRKSLSVRSTPAARAMAMRWMVALVEPPVTITRRTAFSKAFMVMTSRGLMSLRMQVCSATLARSHSSIFSGCSPPAPPLSSGSQAGMLDE
mmetsp:Transcript_37762/g.88853  ORF Transcript_37762/g.88853 Transcript_37762/m.88853 type:complete len:335 (+) Transcript_37762:311-1315(+)